MRGPSLDLKPQILDRIAAAPSAVWTPVDFLDIGPRAATDKALQRLVKTKELQRLDRGLYYMPRKNSLTGRSSSPDTRAVIDAVSRRDQARLVADGLTAANDLGLTTAIPSQVVVLSDARLRPIKLGNQTIKFRQAAPSRLFWAGRPAMRVVQALYWLQDLITSGNEADSTARLQNLLGDPARGQPARDDLREGLPTLPIWMQSYLREVLQDADPSPELPLGRAMRHTVSSKSPRVKRESSRSIEKTAGSDNLAETRRKPNNRASTNTS